MLTMKVLKVGKFETAIILSIYGLRIQLTLLRNDRKQRRIGKKTFQ